MHILQLYGHGCVCVCCVCLCVCVRTCMYIIFQTLPLFITQY